MENKNNNIYIFNNKSRRARFLILTFNSIIRRWYYSIPTIFFTTLIVICLVLNIVITGKITELLISQNFADIITNKQALSKVLLCGNILDPKTFDTDYSKIYNSEVSGDQLQTLIQSLYYKDVIVKDTGGVFYLLTPLNLVFMSIDLTAKQYSIFIAINLLSVVVATYIAYLFAGILAESEKVYLKNRIASKLIDQDIHYINHHKISSLVTTAIDDVEFYGDNLKLVIILFYQSILTFILATMIMIKLNLWMTTIIAGLIVMIVVIIGLVMLLRKKITKSIYKSKSQVDAIVAERLKSMTLVKASGTWIDENDRLMILNHKIARKNINSLPLSEIISATIIGGIGTFVMSSIIAGIFHYINNINSLLTVMTTFTTAALVITLPILQLNFVIPNLSNCEEASKSMDKVLKSKIMVEKNGRKIFTNLKKDIVLENVSFAYPDKPEDYYFKNLNLRFEKGKKYAFVGETGSGKSTISKFLLRFYDPTNGIVKIDGVDLRDFDLKSWLDQVGYVEQEPQILSGTIYDNLRYVKQEATDAEIIEACRKAKIHDFIMSLADRYDTVLFEGGSQLSGGQKQRLVIARMFVKDPQVLILDEATSALDNIIESEIQQELDKLMVNRTTISIAHRINTIKNFDYIFVLGNKKGIIQSGTFNELLKADGPFRKIVDE